MALRLWMTGDLPHFSFRVLSFSISTAEREGGR